MVKYSAGVLNSGSLKIRHQRSGCQEWSVGRVASHSVGSGWV
jgi:hypothetical protein